MANEYLTITATSAVQPVTFSDCNTTTVATTYYPYQTWTEPWATTTCIDSTNSVTIIREITKEGVTQMDKRTLFKVYVVDPRKNGKILLEGKLVIAVNENQAMLKADVAKIAESVGLELEQVDVYVQTIGTFIRPRKETQKVKVTQDEDD